MLNVVDMSIAKATTNLVSQKLNCTSASASAVLRCLQGVDKGALLTAVNGSGPGAVIDMDVYQSDPLTLIAQGKFNKVPFMFGNNADEGNFFMYPPSANTTFAT